MIRVESWPTSGQIVFCVRVPGKQVSQTHAFLLEVHDKLSLTTRQYFCESLCILQHWPIQLAQMQLWHNLTLSAGAYWCSFVLLLDHRMVRLPQYTQCPLLQKGLLQGHSLLSFQTVMWSACSLVSRPLCLFTMQVSRETSSSCSKVIQVCMFMHTLYTRRLAQYNHENKNKQKSMFV